MKPFDGPSSHGMDLVWQRAVEWAGWTVDETMTTPLARFASWLAEEAVAAGGLGPHERDRILDRHVADSLLFSIGWPPPVPPARVVDLGSGVGLPGIPLAILWPQSEVTLVERSGRRARLLRRALRVLELENAVVAEADAARLSVRAELVVARAAADPDVVAAWADGIVVPGGRVVLGGSHRERPTPRVGEEIIAVPPEVLDRPVWLRMMAPS